MCLQIAVHCDLQICKFATRVSQLKIWYLEICKFATRVSQLKIWCLQIYKFVTRVSQLKIWYLEICKFATRVSQLKIWYFLVIGTEMNVCRRTFNRYSAITQFAKLAAGERLCRRCTHRKL